MPTPALLLLIATLLPLLAFVILLFVGHRMGRPLAGVMGLIGIAGSTACSLAAMAMWLNAMPSESYGAGQGPILRTIEWLSAGITVDVGIYVDSLTIALFSTISLVATLIFIFSLGYMAEDSRYARFFCYLSLFCFSMLGLILSATLAQVFVFWELVGLCSYLLIGFWYQRRAAGRAAIKAFVVNRVGDMGFLAAISLLIFYLGSTTIPALWVELGRAGMLQQGGTISVGDGTTVSYGALTAIGVCLFLGAMGKSAQFPLHTWLPTAMEGPSPVSALIHAATMVAAGVYLMARVFPILTPDARLFVAIIGLTTLSMGALIALAQRDIKRVLAYSTMSQLGYMMLAIGVGSWVGALFHLITHAFFKALLFLSAGSVIHATGHEQDMRKFGGLWRKLPITALAFAIGVLAIAGTPFMAGYYSKSMILSHAAALGITAHDLGKSWAYWLFFAIPTATAYLTAFYMGRCWLLTFAGRPRDEKIYERASESWVLYTPMIALAVLTILPSRYIGVEWLLSRSVTEVERYCSIVAPDKPVNPFRSAWPVILPTDANDISTIDPNALPADASETVVVAKNVIDAGEQLEHLWAFLAFAVGLGFAVIIYRNGTATAERIARVAPIAWTREWLAAGMYFDELYNALIVNVTRALVTVVGTTDRIFVDGIVNAFGWLTRGLAVVAGLVDRHVFDDAVTGVATLANDIGAAVRAPQTGRIRLYVTALVLVIVVSVAVVVVVMTI